MHQRLGWIWHRGHQVRAGLAHAVWLLSEVVLRRLVCEVVQWMVSTGATRCGWQPWRPGGFNHPLPPPYHGNGSDSGVVERGSAMRARRRGSATVVRPSAGGGLVASPTHTQPPLCSPLVMKEGVDGANDDVCGRG
jgi:hypothetical protein